jgi:hypothetical protein
MSMSAVRKNSDTASAVLRLLTFVSVVMASITYSHIVCMCDVTVVLFIGDNYGTEKEDDCN